MPYKSIPTKNYSGIPLRSSYERKREQETQAAAVQKRLFANSKSKRRVCNHSRPVGYHRPAYNTPEYWRDYGRGWINEEEQRSDHADFEIRRKRAVDSKYHKAAPPHRHQRAAPRPSKQFCKSMATQAARDDRLTPQSKALLQVLVARTGRGRSTDTTKTTLGIIMNRCARSIQRYIQELVKFGYIRTQTIKSRQTGFFIGLRIWIMNSVLPFWAGKNTDYEPAKWVSLMRNHRNREETEESLTKDKDTYRNLLNGKKPPWFGEFTYGLECP